MSSKQSPVLVNVLPPSSERTDLLHLRMHGPHPFREGPRLPCSPLPPRAWHGAWHHWTHNHYWMKAHLKPYFPLCVCSFLRLHRTSRPSEHCFRTGFWYRGKRDFSSILLSLDSIESLLWSLSTPKTGFFLRKLIQDWRVTHLLTLVGSQGCVLRNHLFSWKSWPRLELPEGPQRHPGLETPLAEKEPLATGFGMGRWILSILDFHLFELQLTRAR